MKNGFEIFSLRLLFILFIITLPVSISYAQGTKLISGTVVDGNSDPLIGVTIKVINEQLGTVTDFDGKFTLNVKPNSTIEISYVGFETQMIQVGEQTVFDIVLVEDSEVLDELVVIGYGSVRRKDLTGSTISVSADDLRMSPVTSAAQALAGKAAGVNVIQQSGAPGADIQITVRGGTSITQGTEPLYIVDGFQMENGLQNVDINDIESIDVMKDASATAIYGARGSNGVILITTKSGKKGKTEVSYNGFVSFDYLGKKLDLLEVEDYVKYQYEFNLLRGEINNFSQFFGGDINAPDFYTGAYNRIAEEYGNRTGIDWQDLVFGSTGITQNHNININGGSEKTRYMLSYNYTNEDGIMDKHGYAKNSVRTKINHELWEGVRFDFASSAQMTKIDGGGSLGGKLKQTILQPITGGARWTNEEMIGSDIGTEIGNLINDANYDAQNPILDNEAITNKKYTRLITLNAGLEIDIIKNLTFRTAGSYLWQQVRLDYWDDGSTKQASANQSPNGYGYRNNSEKYSWQVTNTLNYSFNVKDVHNFNLLLGQETYYSGDLKLDNEYREFSEGNFGLNQVGEGKLFKASSGKGKRGLVSVFGRVNYNFDDRYLFTGTLRADGSSKFSRGNQWGYFPSASAAWRISEERFMENFKFFLDNLKLRLGYGTAGNNNVDDNMYATEFGTGYYGYGGEEKPTYKPSDVLGNRNLKWEKTTTANLGLDVSLFNNRINLSVDLYNNESSNLLIKNNIPSSTGYSYQFQNIGSIRNRGVEIVLNTTNFHTKDFSWTTDFNIAFNRSKVIDLYGDDRTYFVEDYESRMGYKIEVGKPLGQYYGLIYDGIYTTEDFIQEGDKYILKDDVPYLKGSTRSNVKVGDVKYKSVVGDTDKDGNPVFSIDDRTVIGNANPKFTGGLNNTFRYKGFDLNVFMTFSYGNEIFNMSTQRFIGPYLSNQNTLSKMTNRFMLIDPVTGKESSNLARLAEINPNQFRRSTLWNISANNKNAISDHSSYYLEDGSFLRLSTITLGYTLPAKIVRKAKISNARIYCTLNNIYTFTNYSGYDPEVSAKNSALTPGIDNSSYPRSKSWVLGVNLTF